MRKLPRQYVFEALEFLPDVLSLWVKLQLVDKCGSEWQNEFVSVCKRLGIKDDGIDSDPATLLKIITDHELWEKVFRHASSGRALRSQSDELLDARNMLSHNNTVTFEDADRVVGTLVRLLERIGAHRTVDRIVDIQLEIRQWNIPFNQMPHATIFPSQRRSRNRSLGEEASQSEKNTTPNQPRGFLLRQFTEKLHEMVNEAGKEGKETVDIVSRDLHKRVRPDTGYDRIVTACTAMRYLWEEQGGRADYILDDHTRSGNTTTLEIRFDTKK